MKKYFISFCLLALIMQTYAQRTVGIIKNDSTSYNGYTLIAPMASKETYLIDNCGDVVNSWRNSNYFPGPVVYLLEDGSILRTCKLTTGSIITGGSGGRLERYNWNDSLIWSYNFDSPVFRQHHDVKVLQNGNILVLAWDVKSRLEAISAGLDTNHFNDEVWSEKVTEITPIGADSAVVVWEWKLWDHIIQDIDSSLSNYGPISSNRHKVDLNYYNNTGISKDYFHANGMDYNANLDQIMICVRNYDEFWIIDHSTTTAQAATSSGGNSGLGGGILYRWGNPETYGMGDVSDKKLFGPHDPNWIPLNFRDGGQILFFNNGFNDTNQVSRVETIIPPLSTNGTYSYNPAEAFGPQQTSWSYEMPIFVDFVSGANRLANGNTFITSGPDAHLYEIDAQDSLVWEYISPVQQNGPVSQGSIPSSNTVFRTYRYGENHPAFATNTIRNYGPLELNPLPSNCTLYPNTPVGLSKENETNFDVMVIANPITNELRIQNNTSELVTISVFDAMGRLITREQSNSTTLSINSSNWKPDLYIVMIQSNEKIHKRKVIKVNY